MRTKNLSLIRLKKIQIQAIWVTLWKFQLDQSQGQGPGSWRRHWMGWFKIFGLCKQIEDWIWTWFHS